MLKYDDVFGLIRPAVDAHTLGISAVGKLLEECGYKVFYGDAAISRAVARITKINNIGLLTGWIKKNRITRLGFSYRLEPENAQIFFGIFYKKLKEIKLLQESGGAIRRIYFAGLPEACAIIKSEYDNKIPVFSGDETQAETLMKIGVPQEKIPVEIFQNSQYDTDRMSFARQLIEKGNYHYTLPQKTPSYKTFGTFKDTVVKRIEYNRANNDIPLMRAHAGPYSSNYGEAKKEFKAWLKTLADAKFLDIVSIGTSQLSQSDFGMEWGDKPNGGGVPINSEQDLVDIWEASRPMLVRTYAGTRNIPYLAGVYERTINTAWHALSFWWFNIIDGRGHYNVRENLREHMDTLKYIAKTGKPFEPNIPHHFSFRGGDDYTYVLSAYLAAKTAKKYGVRYLILQTMLNTPKYTWGIQDLAKTRALLMLARELEDGEFKVFLQPRAGLDYFSPDIEKAKIQLSAVSAMMDDIEPENNKSPDIIHVVSYCEAVKLATPAFINESIQITTKSLQEYRRLKESGLIDDMKNNREVEDRTKDIHNEVKKVVNLLENDIPDVYSAQGLYDIFKRGIMPVPYLWECRKEFEKAVKWKTGLVNGAVKVIDSGGKPIIPSKRVKELLAVEDKEKQTAKKGNLI